MKTKVKGAVIFLIIAGLVIVGIAFLAKENTGGAVAPSKTLAVTETATSTQSSGQASPSAKTYTLADVEKHNSETSCWTAINGSVYNVTAWISEHPGGPDRILGLCGTDGSAAFNGQHEGQTRPADELATFKIGVLK